MLSLLAIHGRLVMTLHPLVILLLATGAVLGTVLVLRLHAFLALILGAFLVALLTPEQTRFSQALSESGRDITDLSDAQEFVWAKQESLKPGKYHLFRYDPEQHRLGELAVLQLQEPVENRQRWRSEDNVEVLPQIGDLLVNEEQIANAQTAAKSSVGERLAKGFGSTCTSIGLLIAMASIIGKCMLESGAASCIVLTVSGWLGQRWTPVAFAASSFLLAIPVFFDTVFYLMIPLAREMARKSGKDYLLYILSIVAGGSIAHSLVPPTPGPLFVASELNVSVGLMMIGGAAVAATGVVCVFPYLLWANRRWPISPDRGNPDASQSSLSADLPRFGIAILPILLPVVLIGGRTIAELFMGDGSWRDIVDFLGNKNIALMISATVALAMLWGNDSTDSGTVQRAVQESLSSAGVIILITAAGGAFGSVLGDSGIAPALQDMLPRTESGIFLLLLAFLLTTLIRAAQGSATVAMIASAGIIAPLAMTLDLPYHPLYLALAIGSGSKPLPWMNDSGFWIIGKMSGLTESETLKTFSVVLTIMGVACFAATIAGAIWLPLK